MTDFSIIAHPFSGKAAANAPCHPDNKKRQLPTTDGAATASDFL
jgi:hypothetical protein